MESLLTNAKEIHSSAMKQLEERQKEKAMLEHSLQSDYLRLRRLVGREEAERFLEETKSLVF